MFKIFEQILKRYTPKSAEKSQSEAKNTPICDVLLENLISLRKDFDGSVDFTVREFEIAGTRAALITMEGMINKQVLANSVINPIVGGNYKRKNPVEKYEYIRDNLLSTSEQVQIVTLEEVEKFIMSGFAVLALDGCTCMLAIGIQGFSFRSISEPESEVMQTGSREGFVEALRINMTLVRRRMKNPRLKLETMTVGSVSNTDICLCYLSDKVSPAILQKVKEKINKIDLQTVLAAGYISPYLEEARDFSLFSSVGMSERPDTICGKIAEGRIAILIDGIPNALIVPYLFVEYFQTLDDYSERPYFATLTRWLKYISFFIATLLPGLYVAIGTFHPELFPGELLNKIAKAIATTPFPLMLETLVIHFIYEIMREAGLRLPRPLGHAVSIVGALVIGDTAVSAGLIGAPTLMVVALTAISSYVIPALYEPIAVLRMIFIIVGGLSGIWGIMLLFSAVLINICAKSNYGVPFSSPLSPFSFSAMRDVVIRAGWKTLSKRQGMIQSMPGAVAGDKEE